MFASSHDGRGAVKHPTTRQQPLADLLHEGSFNTLQQLGAALAKRQLLTCRIKGGGIVNEICRLRAQLAEGRYGERYEAEVSPLQKRSVF